LIACKFGCEAKSKLCNESRNSSERRRRNRHLGPRGHVRLLALLRHKLLYAVFPLGRRHRASLVSFGFVMRSKIRLILLAAASR
jgi:hypothetical protein